jgi:anaerobic ribonucleoside-triphosphate reductase activating protein
MRISGTIKHSLVNGQGIRFVIFFQGCLHRCEQCQNPETWDLDGGVDTDPDDLISMILNTEHLDGVTLSGGDPFLQAECAAYIASKCHENGLDVWCYTGYTFEQILNGNAPAGSMDLLKNCDVLVDGPFVTALRSSECSYRGSSNQRLIDVAASLEDRCAVII